MGLDVAVVGLGKVAHNYLAALAKQEDVTLSYYNRTAQKATDAAQQYGGRAFGSIAELMAEDPDTVLVLTAETARLQVANALLDHGPRRLFFEKPLVAARGQADVTEADFFAAKELLRRAAAQNVETAMVFNYRFFEQTQRARQIVAARDFGRPLHFSALVHYACWSHCIDLILDFMGPALQISALATEGAGPCMGSEGVRNVAVSARMQNDATGSIIGTCGIDFKLPLYELTFAYERGRLSMRDLDGEMEVLDYGSGRHEQFALARDVSRWDQYRASFGKAINAYLQSIRDGVAPPVPGMAGLRELQFEAAIKRSVAQGAPVDLDAVFSLD